MEDRLIQGMTKSKFLEQCIIIADSLNPNWQQELFRVDNFVPSVIWVSKLDYSGLSLSSIGATFFIEALQLTPYYIETNFMYSRNIIDLNKAMPWPFTINKYEGSLISKIGIFSSEVAVWAALYDNDLEKLLESYSRK